MSDLAKKATEALVQYLLALAVLLFAAAWTLNYWQAWLYLAVFGGCCAAISAYLMKYDRPLLERRMKIGSKAEQQPAQKRIIRVSGLIYLAIMIFPAVDHRLGWSPVPVAASIAGEAAVALGLYIVFATFRANSFTAATVEVAEGQALADTGPYAVVRHPMYLGGLIMLLGTPLALDSALGMLLDIPMALALAWRLTDEESLLRQDLPGYEDYHRRVRWRLVPGVW